MSKEENERKEKEME